MHPDFELIKDIIRKAVVAPSGENTQPWRFVLRGNTVSILNLPERDNPVYNFRQRGSFFAHGALIENMELLALGAGYRLSFLSYFDPAKKDHVADCPFEFVCWQTTKRFPRLHQRLAICGGHALAHHCQLPKRQLNPLETPFA